MRETDDGSIVADHGIFSGVSEFSVDDAHKRKRSGIVGGIMELHNPGRKFLQLSGDSMMMTRVEHETRRYIAELARFVKKHVPGF